MDIRRTFDILQLFEHKYQKPDVLASKVNGEWKKYSSNDYINISNYVSYGLLELGLQKGDKIAIISNNRPEWNFLDMGMSQIGAISLPIYPTIGTEEYKYILQHSEPKLIVVSDKTLYEKVGPLINDVNSIRNIYTFNQIEGSRNFNEIVSLGKNSIEKYEKKVLKLKESISENDMATLIYTSGTTGFPKGVMLSHKNIVSNVKAVTNIHNCNSNHRTLSFLPLCHVFERMVNYHYQYMGLSTYYAENLGTIAQNLEEVKPHLFVTVPRLLEGIYDKIVTKVSDMNAISRIIFYWAISVGNRFKHGKTRNLLYFLQLKIADKLVFKKWRKALGGNVGLIITGGAALQPRLSRIFSAAGLPALEGYGLTETSPVLAANNIKNGEIMFGTVGTVIDGVEIKIAPDGEILAKGDNIMLGYYKEPKLTRESIDKDGWFHTGDIGKLINNKYLKITDRKKEIFKLSSGKYIAPQVIENKFKESIFIHQIMVVGQNQKFASAIISPNFQYLEKWTQHHHIKFQDKTELIKNSKVLAEFQKEITHMNHFFGQHEQIKRFRLIPDEWSPQTGELSPTLKKKRRIIAEKYTHILQEIYSVEKSGMNESVVKG